MSEGCAKSGLLSSIAIILLLFLSGSAGVFCPIENVDANGTSCNYQVIPILVPIEETLLTTDDFVQGPAEIGQPVRWRRIFTPSRTSNSMEIELHANAFDIALNAPVNGTHFWLSPSSWSIERYASSPRGDKGIFRMIFNAGLPSGSTGEVEAEYYTEAPAINVTPLSHDKIAVRVSSQTHYQNILAYADVPDTQYREGGISLYLTTNGTFEQAQITNYSDTNGNGFIDRIYWIVPHLSEQTYEIVLISGAEHLDENRTFVEDAYEYVRTRGDNLSIQIPDGHYLRAAFERPLNSSADITIYASSNSSNASVAVYERNESTLLADFGTISQYGKYQVFLTLLNGTQDTFDLRVSGGEVVFDYVTDPPYNDTMMSLNPNFRWVLDGDFTDEMGNLDGTPGQAPDYVATIIPHSEHPQCGDFTPNDEMHVADDPLINTGSGYVGEVRSISVWFIADTIPTNDGNVIWGEGGGSNSLSVYTYDDGGTTKVYCAAVEGGNEDWVEYPITAGELYHLGCTYDFPNDEINMYLNGTLVDTDNSLSIGASLNSHGANNALGGQDGNTDNHLGTQMSDNFDGRIADFAYWSGGTVLSAENMSAIFNSGMYGSPSGEVEWNVSSLDLGTAYTSEPPTGAASITSNGTNSNATVSCVYGNCTKIADSWIDGTNMSDSQSFDVNFTCNSTTAGSFSALFNATSDEDATPSQINVSCTLMQPSVEWNMSELEIGTAEPDEGSLHGSANITSNGTNSNVALSCVYGNCTEITEDWLDTTDMHDGETFMVNFTCSNSSIGNFSAIFNLTSDWDASPEQVNVTCTIDYYPSIHIISAVHLDENRLFIEDVYEKVKTIDSLRARIPPTHYLRVVFDRELDASKDITIYAAHPPGPGTPYVDVYEEGGSTAIASFGEISQYGKYQTFLTLLNGTQDTFDLRVIGAQVGFDYVTDPPQWDYNFSKCKNITLTNVGTTNLTDFTIYVNVSYDSDMRSDYGDIRFVDSPCDSGGNPFNYEIEYTDANHADTWVRLDYLPPEGRIISMYYGNDSTASSQNPATAWNYTYTSIYHLNHTSGNAIDTMGNHSATEVVDPDSNMDVLGMFGRADYFDGSDYLDNNPKWSVTAPFAYEAWIRADTSSSDMIILEDGAQVQGAGIGVSSSGYFVFGGYYSSSYRSANSTAAVDDNQWHYVVGVNEPGYNMLAYVDGVLVANTSGIAGGLNPGSNGAAIAFVNNIDSTFPSGGTYFTGYLDEIRVSTNVLRTSDWINQTYLAVVNQSGIVAFGAEQARDGSGASVSWNVSSLDLGVGAQSGGPIAGSANITSSGTNSNITVSCDSGNCSTISEDWIDSTNMTDGQSFIANFSCSNSTAGNFSATFNLSSAQDTSIEQIVVNCTIVTPPGITINSPSGILADVTPALNITLDQAADTLWYNVDGGANSTICTSCGGEQATFLHLAEGSYTIHVYANNTVGQNYENSSFTVDMNGNYFDSFEDNSSVETYEGVTYNPGNISFEGSGSSPPDSWWDPSFSRCRNITVTNVGSSTLTNFPLYVNVTYDSDMKADYSDLRFVNTSCNNNGSALDFEIEYSNASHAATWVEIPSLPAGGTTISVYYGNSSASPAHNPSGVWDSNYAAIYHFNHTTGALADTKGAFNVPDGMSPDSNKDVMGVTGRADYFDGGDYFGPQSWDLDDTGTGFAYCAWVRFSSTSLMVVAEDGAYVSGAGIGMTGGNLRFGVSISSTHYPIDSTSTYNDDSWHYMCGVSTGTQTQLYVDGELDGQETRTAAIGTDAGGVGYGLGGSAGNAVSGDGSSNYYYTGYMDELWMSYTSRSADWINQTYQAIASQASIVSIGGEESSAGSSGGSGNFTSYSINTTGLIGSFLDITWNEVGTDSTNNISVKISVDNGNNYYAATNGSSLSGFTPGSAIIYRAIFTTDSAATIALTDMNITWASEAVSWNQSSLDLGTADPASGPLEGSANISSIGANNNVAVACDSGDCAIITEDWIDTIDMVDGQSFQANFTCSNSTEGVFSAVFNVTSDEDAEPDQINVSCTMDAPLAVSLISPPNASTDTDGNITFTCGATDGDGLENITLYGNWSGSSVEAYVDWLYNESIWRYNDSGVWPGTDWNGTAYDDSQWPEGPGTLGYDTAAASHLNTIISANGSVAYVSYYFRNNFSVTDASDVTQMNFTIDYDDGYVVFINGHEVDRSNNMAGVNETDNDAITTSLHNWYCDGGTCGTGSDPLMPTYTLTSTELQYLVDGTNYIAVLIKQSGTGSSDVAFAIALNGYEMQPNGGTWEAIETQNITGTSNSTSFDVYNLTDGEYAWNCLAYNSLGEYNWSTYNYTLLVNTSVSSVSWGAPTLDLGTGDPSAGPLEGQASITSIWSNNNVAVTCDSGDCATITEDWLDTIDMGNGQSFLANFTCGNSTEGTFSAVFNLTSDNDTEPAQLTVTCGMDSPMTITLASPEDDSVDVDGSITFTCNATDLTGMQNITLWGNWSDASVGMNEYITWVYNDSYWRYNDSGVWPGADWNGTGFDDSAWPFGQGPFGNDSTANLLYHVNTVLAFNDFNDAYTGYYFRTTFNITNTSAITEMNFTTDYDDGYVVFINGYEINRSDNLIGVDETDHDSITTDFHHWSCDDDDCSPDPYKEPMFPNITLANEQIGYLVNGTNHVAVLLKQRSNDSGDALIAFRLYGYQNTTWGPIETNPLTGTENSTTFIVNGLENGTYEWNCIGYDSNGNSGWASSNYSFEVNTSAVAVEWNQSELDLGSTYAGEPVNSSANITSTGSNTNVTVSCDSGDCTEITDDWADGTNMSDAQSLSANFTCNAAISGNFSAIFNLTSNEDSASQSINVSCEALPTIVSWNQSTLDLGSTYASEAATSSANITSNGTNNNVQISCSSGNCTEITEDWLDTTDMSDGQSFQANFTCNSTSAGSFSAIFSVISDTDTTPDQINVSCIVDPTIVSWNQSSLDLGTMYPSESLNSSADITSTGPNANVTVSCASGNCTEITDDWVDGTNMPDAQSLQANFTCTSVSPGNFSAIFNVVSDTDTTADQIEVNCTVEPTIVSWNQSTLDLGSTYASEAATSSANITSNGTNNNVQISCSSGNCTEITEDWLDTTDMSDGQSFQANFTCNSTSAGSFSAIFSVISDTDTTPDQINVSCEILPILVEWNVSFLDLGSGTPAGGPITGSANITSNGTNNNVAVACDSGNCSIITEDWLDTIDMGNGQSFQANFTCSNSTAGNFSATFNVTSDEDATADQVVVNCTMLSAPSVTISAPTGTFADVTPLLNASVDKAADTFWYNIDGGANVTLCTSCSGEQTKFLHLAEGSYTLYVYANDSVGEGMDSASFTVDMDGNYYDSFEDNSSVEDYGGVVHNPGNVSFTNSGSGAPASWWDDDFSRCKDITITNVGTTTLNDFTIYVNVTYDSDMRSDYGDIRFIDAACSDNGSPLNYEIEYTDANHADTWVRLDSLPPGGRTISVYYGNATATSTQNPATAWNYTYTSIYHLNHTSGNAIDTMGNHSATEFIDPDSNMDVLGMFGRADYFDVIDYLGGNPEWAARAPFAYEAWIRVDGSSSNMIIMEDGATVQGAGIGVNSSGYFVFGGYDASLYYSALSTSTVDDNQWHYVVGVNDESYNLLVYVDGVLEANTTGLAGGLDPGANDARIAFYDTTDPTFYPSGTGTYFNGYLEEIRVSTNVLRTSDWIAQTYAAAVNQSGVVSMGAEQSASNGHGNFTSYSINTTSAVGSFLDISWNEIGTDSANNITVEISVDNGNTWHSATNASPLSGFTPGSAIVYRALFSASDLTTIALADMNITWVSEAVFWNVSTLNLGSGPQSGGPLEGSANITSIGTNNNVAVACDSGDCAIITEDWIDTTDMTGGQSFSANFTCDNSTEGSFYAIFNVTSDEDSFADQINVSCKIDNPLVVELLSPPNDSTDGDGNITFACGATDGDGLENITLYGNWSGSSVEVYVDWLQNGSIWRYNDSGAWPGTDWNGTSYDDSQWPEGPGLLGYDPDVIPLINTTLAVNGSVAYVSYYFRNNFSVTDASDVTQMNFTIDYDDGYVVFINGYEVSRSTNMNGVNETDHDSLATAYHNWYCDGGTCGTGTDPMLPTYTLTSTELQYLVDGTNYIAVLIKQADTGSSDVAFALALNGYEMQPTEGTWEAVETQNITGTSNSTSFDVYNLTDGEYAWNCLAYNSLGGYNWSTYNYTIKVNTSSSSVSWNQSILNLGTGDPASGPLEGSAAITSTWSNENVAVTCDSGDCATITETWIDTTDMANEESLPANFTCSNSTEGTFSAIFNLTSDNDTEPAQLTVNCKIDSTMVVELLTPADDSVDADGSITFTCNATDLTGMQNITLWGNWSDASVGMNEYATWVYNDSYWRYNDSDVWPGADWNGSSFDDSQWPFAQGPFGNDSTANLNAHVNTILTFGDTGLAYVSYYFRTTFNITNTSAITEMNFTTDYDDGYVVFINGYEINRSDNLLGVDETSHSATTTEYHHWSCDDDDCAIKASKVPMYPNITLSSEQMGYLVNGTNHIAVLLKQRSGDGTDALIALRLYGYQNTTWGPIETNPLSGTENSTAFIVNGLENGTYEWNCLAYDSNGNPGWAPANYSFEVNTSSIAVHWNQTSLGLGSAYIGSGPLNGSANVASTGSNTNVTAECVFGNCAQITEDWVDGINMSDAQSFKANFTCASAVGGNFSALFNLTSNEDSAPQPLNVSCEIIEIPYAPVTENVTLNTSLGTNTTDENLTLHYDSYDLNGDAIKNITNWHLDGQPFALLYLPFEANSSSSSYTKDYSNRSNDGTVYNATWSATGGYDGFGAYDFTRTPSSSISIGKKLINNSPSFSAFAWVYPESDFYGGIITQDLGSSIREWFLAHNTNHTLRIRIYNESFSIFQNDSAGNTVPLNTWTHVGIVVDDDAKMAYGYINGEVATSIAFTGPLRTSTEAVTKIGWTYSDDYDFEGLIDEVLIYNRSLSPEQVEALYNNRTDLIVSNETDLGDIWYACVTPNDGNGDGSQACSNTVTIAPLNPPQIISYNINYTNYWVRSNEELFLNITNCTGGALAYNWTVDGAIASSSSSFSMDGSAYSLGVHNVTAKCYDPLGRSDNVSFSIEVIHKDDFTLLVIPDTEAYAESYPNIFTNQTYWATELKDELNMVFATHLGDVVADGSSNASEWINANDSMSLLDNLLPYALSIGEHDYDDEGTTRAATYWANYFPITRYNGESWWGGQNNSNENYNTYQYFNASGIQFMVLHLEFCPRDETIAWANQTIINNPDKIVIISTHLYLNDDNTTIDSGDSRNCDTYGVGGNNGDGQWDKLVKYHPNVYLVVSGHVLDTGVGYLNSTGTNGNEIHQVLSNYEMKSEGGAGYLRIMRFSPIENKVIIQSYSPYEDSFYTDISNEFNISGFLNAPYVALDTPAAGYSNDTLLPVNLAFNATVSSTNGLANCSLWHSISGWSLNQTINVTGTLNSTEFNLTGLSNTSFTWNIQCFDNEGNSGWGSPNRTVALGNATAPVTVNVTLNTSLGLNGPNENLTLYYYSYDLSDDAIKNITNWYLNGTPIMLLNMPFEGGSNSTYAKDYSNLSNYGTVYNATWGAASGYDGFGAYEFTPSPASSISIGKKLIDTPRSFSAFAWAYPYSYSYGAIVSQDEGGNDREWFLARFGTSLRIRVYNTSIGGSFENDSAADTFPQDKWSYVGIVVNDSAKMVYGYINGQLATSVAYTGTLRTTTTALTKIGWMYSDAYVFDGRIDDVQIYNRSLSAAQVLALYENRTDIIAAQETNLNETWRACVTPNDGTYEGATACSNNVFLTNNPPPFTVNVSLNSTFGTNYTTENLTVYYTSYDAYGQPVKNVTNWYLNSTPIMPLNMPFEGGSNSTRTKDYSNYSNNGTVNGATWNSSGGYDGHGAYNFSNKNITIADSPSLDLPSSLSVEAWVRPAILNTTAAKWNSIVTKGFSGDGGGVDHNYLLGHCYNALGGYGFCFTLENATGANCNVAVGATVASVATTGQWYHVVGVFDDANDRLLIYVNGTLLGNASCPYSPNTNARPVLIGDDEHYDGWPWYGTIDDVKIYNRSLSTDQVSALYQNRTNLIVSQETRVNDTWYACITPNDKTQDGAAACSNKLTVIAGGNVAPLTQNVTLNSTLGTNLTTENLTLYYDSYDGNNDAIKNITTWYLNHTTIMLLNMPFEGGSTSTYAKDYSNLTNDGTVGNATYNATGGYDGMGAYHFTQTPTSAISMGAKIIGTPGSFTATAWVYPESDILGGIVSQDNGVGNREWLIGQVPGYAMRVTICNESQTCFENDSSAGTLPQDTWSHVAIAVNDSAKTAYGYINGVRIINVSYLGDMSTSTNAVTKIGWAYADAYDFAGTIDDVQIYNRSLSAEQIRAIYQNRTNLIVSQETRVNDTWYACVTPNDRTLDGSPACSNNLTIREPVSGITSCIQINSSGNYTLSSNLVGAPINVSGVTDVTRACVVISASNVTLNCNGRTITNNGTLDAAGILINGSTTMEYPNVTISNCPGVSLYERGIYLHRTRYDELRNVSANGSVYGVYTHYSSNLTIRNAIAYNNTYGIYLYASPGNNVSNASAYNNTYGIYLYSSSSNRLFNATVSNSTYGVYSYSSSYNSISNSTFRNSTSYGVYLYSSSNRNNVTNSAFYGNYRGIAPTTSSWNTFENNTIYGAGVYGIYAYSGSNYNIMRGNTVANHTSYSIIIYTNCNYNLVTNNSVSAGAGSVYLSGAIGTNVTNNTFSGATTYGVYAYNSNNSRIINNSISGALRGVYVSSPYLTVSNNSISNATQYGIYLYGSYSNVTGNRIYNNTQYGIYQTSSNNHIISGNNITSNGIGGIYLASTASTTTVYGNYVCSNGVDITNASASTTGDEDTCDLWSNWGEKGRPGCTYRCTNLWHTIYGSSGTTVMVLAEANMTVFEYNWSASAYNVYAVNTAKSASLSWSTLLALGRNTSIQPSTSDFTELDTLLGTSAESDRVEIVYSTDGTTPKLTTDRDIFYQNVQYIPIANSTNASSFITGILWDYSSDTDSQFSASDNETVVFWAAINSSSIGAYGTYDYEIRVPDKFATYAPGATTVDIYLELI